MKEHNPFYLVIFLGGLMLLGYGVVNSFVYPLALCFLGLPMIMIGGIFYFAFEKIIPCPKCNKKDKVRLSDWVRSEACGTEEQVENLLNQPGDLWCKRCGIKFGYE